LRIQLEALLERLRHRPTSPSRLARHRRDNSMSVAPIPRAVAGPPGGRERDHRPVGGRLAARWRPAGDRPVTGRHARACPPCAVCAIVWDTDGTRHDGSRRIWGGAIMKRRGAWIGGVAPGLLAAALVLGLAGGSVDVSAQAQGTMKPQPKVRAAFIYVS